MAYEPKTWVTGEVITADALNHIENGIGTFYITLTTEGNTVTLSASYNDIVAAINAGKFVAILRVAVNTINIIPCIVVGQGDGEYYASFGDPGNPEEYGAPSADIPMSNDSGGLS